MATSTSFNASGAGKPAARAAACAAARYSCGRGWWPSQEELHSFGLVEGIFKGKIDRKTPDSMGQAIVSDLSWNQSIDICSFWTSISGWWLSHLSKKYESQLGWLDTQYATKNKTCSKPPARSCFSPCWWEISSKMDCIANLRYIAFVSSCYEIQGLPRREDVEEVGVVQLFIKSLSGNGHLNNISQRILSFFPDRVQYGIFLQIVPSTKSSRMNWSQKMDLIWIEA